MSDTAAPQMRVTYKRTARCRTVLSRDIGDAGWTVADGRKYARGMTETRPDVEVTLWVGPKIEVIYRNGMIA